MPDLIILRLHPIEPMSGSDFRTLLNGLTITAFDLSFAKSVGGDQIGVAQGLADPHTGAHVAAPPAVPFPSSLLRTTSMLT